LERTPHLPRARMLRYPPLRWIGLYRRSRHSHGALGKHQQVNPHSAPKGAAERKKMLKNDMVEMAFQPEESGYNDLPNLNNYQMTRLMAMYISREKRLDKLSRKSASLQRQWERLHSQCTAIHREIAKR